jgi:hypothetical protein
MNATVTPATTPTIEVLAKHLSHGNSVLEDAIKAAAERGIRYGIEPYRDHDKMGRLWLVAGGPRSQTYWTETRILREDAKKNQHDPSCTPAYLCDKCVDAIVDSIGEDNHDEVVRKVHNEAAERAEQNKKEAEVS